MILATVALGRQSLNLAYAAIFLASTQAALFSPSKYGLLPELLPKSRLSWGNGLLELWTFLALILAVFSAGLMSDKFPHQALSCLVFLALSGVGLLCSLGITKVPAAAPDKKFIANRLGDLWTQGNLIRKDRVLWLAVLGNTYFWFLATLLMSNILFYGKE